MLDPVPSPRVMACNRAPVHPEGAYVLYWMIAARRPTWNYALQHAVRRALELKKPLLVFEPLRCGYPWASDRLHRFVIDGMKDNAAWFVRKPVHYFPYLEPKPGAGRGLLAALAGQAAVVITDHFPCFFLPRMVDAAARQLEVLLEKVDSNGLLPIHATPRDFSTAHAFRRFLQQELPAHLSEPAKPDPLARADLPRLRELPATITRRWPDANLDAALAEILIDHSVTPADISGGFRSARQTWHTFLDEKLSRYADDANHPDNDIRSGLSPFLHFGHISSQQIFHELMTHEGWSPALFPDKRTGSRTGFWDVSPSAQAFLDQLITWRELSFNMCVHRPDYSNYDSLPDWAKATLKKHARDRRPFRYTLEEFESARTHDEVWNAAQTQLLHEGRIHNYLRMLWGKKILEWSPSPQLALETMIHLNDKYALDGRDPNSYSGIFWVLGRYDRPWGPERPVFGTVRYMSSENARRKLRMRRYLEEYSADPNQRRRYT